MSAWYQKLHNVADIQQGDLIEGCPTLEAPANLNEAGQYLLKASIYNVIVMTQSCDLLNHKAEYVTVCPYVPFSKYFQSVPIEPTVKSDDAKLLKAKISA